MITVLCGGVGGSRFVRALASTIEPERITAIINTADDDEFHGLYVSPDPDIVTYALAGEVDEERGWGFRGETFRWLEHMRRFGHETWFQIGDRDLATHIHRTRLLRDDLPLSAVVADIARGFGVRVRLLPMSDDRVRTVVETDGGDVPFQRFLIERHAQDPVRGVRFEGAGAARPAPGVLDAIREAEALFIAPSNPIGSIAPILAVPGIREAVAQLDRPRIAVSPIIAGRSLQPPAAEMMAGLGHVVDVTGVARMYAGLIDGLIIDEADGDRAAEIEPLGVRCIVAPTLMRDEAARRHLAAVALDAAGITP
ncbi:MAG: 2-phospho-L-lactate transferase [Chloroflexi bacterium]|nr:2-phospho-L-lactate transferase [Chloroflexota bacterium]